LRPVVGRPRPLRGSSRRRTACVQSAVVLLASIALGGCAEHPFVWVADLPNKAEAAGTIGPRDTLLVLVRNQASLSGEFVVRDDGAYLQPTVGNLSVAGKTSSAVAAELAVRLKDMIVNPDVSVEILKTAPIHIDVVGEVKMPGAYDLTRDRGVIAALAAAGWLTDFARSDRIFVVRGTDHRIRFEASALTSAEPHAAAFRLHDGDVVVVE
jgi:protein involved in polysaccharide export with SLBB domain